MLAALNALNEIQNESENETFKQHHHENELYAAEPYKGPNSMQNNHETHENSIKREYGMESDAQMINKDENLCYRDKFHPNMQKNDYKSPHIMGPNSYEMGGHHQLDNMLQQQQQQHQQQHRATTSHNNNYGFMHQHHHSALNNSIAAAAAAAVAAAAEQEKTNFRQHQQHTTNYEQQTYMNCQQQQQQQQQQQPKMQMSNPVPQQQQQSMPPRYGPPMDDPYNFVDDDDSMSKQQGGLPPGMHQNLGGPPQQQQQQQMMMQPNNGPNVQQHQIIYQPAGLPPGQLQQQPPPHMMGGDNGGYTQQQLPVPQEKTARKRGRKKKGDEISDPNASLIPRPPKERKKHDRFNGMPEAEVVQRVLPDHLHENLDIVIIGINPGLFAAFKGHHYAGPGNHFWKCLHMSGLTPEQMSAEDDYKLLQYGIGFTNMVSRPTKGSADLTRKEIKEGSVLLLEKLRRYKPKIAVFNGKLIFEVFSGKKDFNFGKQADLIEGTNTHMWVMPSSSARCAQLPRAADKVPFYAALKSFRDYLNGHIEHLDESEVVFDDPRYKNCVESEKQPADFAIAAFGSDGLPLLTQQPIDDGKKKRGRPKKTKIILNENGEPVQVENTKKPSPAASVDPNIALDPSKKKRGRPKKVKGNDVSQQQQQQQQQPQPPPVVTAVPTPAVTPNGAPQQFQPQNGTTLNNGPPNRNPTPQQQQQTTNLNSNLQQQQTHFNSPNFNIMHHPVDTLTPPPSVGYQQQNMSFSNAMQSHMQGSGGGGGAKGGNNGSNNASVTQHPGYQQSPQPHSQGYPQSDVGSDLSAAMSGGEHMSNSPATVTSPVDFGRSSSDNTQNECRFSSPASTISEQQSQNSQQHMHSMQQQQIMQSHQQHQRQHQGTPDMNYPSPYCTPQHPGSREGANTPQFASYSNEHMNYQQQQQQQNVKTQSPHHNFGHMSGSMARNSPHPHPHHHHQQQQQQQHHNHPATKTPPIISTMPSTKEINCNDVATKSLSGLESLVDQIPTEADRLSGASGGAGGDYVKSETLTESVLNQYQPPAAAAIAASDYSAYTSSSASSFSSASPYATHYTTAAAAYNMSSPFSVNNLLTSNSYGGIGVGPPAGMNNYPGAKTGGGAGPPPGPHHLVGPAGNPASAHLFMPEPPHMPVPMFPYTQQNPYPTYPTATPHPSLLQPTYSPYSPYSNPGFSSHHMFDRF